MDSQDIQKYLETIKRSRVDQGSVPKAVAMDPQRMEEESDIKPVQSVTQKNFSIDPNCDLRGKERMAFGNNVVIQEDCWLNIAFKPISASIWPPVKNSFLNMLRNFRKEGRGNRSCIKVHFIS